MSLRGAAKPDSSFTSTLTHSTHGLVRPSRLADLGGFDHLGAAACWLGPGPLAGRDRLGRAAGGRGFAAAALAVATHGDWLLLLGGLWPGQRRGRLVGGFGHSAGVHSGRPAVGERAGQPALHGAADSTRLCSGTQQLARGRVGLGPVDLADVLAHRVAAGLARHPNVALHVGWRP